MTPLFRFSCGPPFYELWRAACRPKVIFICVSGYLLINYLHRALLAAVISMYFLFDPFLVYGCTVYCSWISHWMFEFGVTCSLLLVSFSPGDRSFGSQPGSARSSLSSLSDSVPRFSYSTEVRVHKSSSCTMSLTLLVSLSGHPSRVFYITHMFTK